MKLKRSIALAYMVFLHVLLIFLFSKTNLFDRIKGAPNLHVVWMGHQHARMDPLVPDGYSIFLGDSITAGLVTSLVDVKSVNFGVNSLTSDQLIKNLKAYDSVNRAGRIFVLIGINDISRGNYSGIEGRMTAISEAIPGHIPVVWSLIMPTDNEQLNARIKAVNDHLRTVCGSRPNCSVVDTWPALQALGEQAFTDGLHLSTKGYSAWISLLQAAAQKQ